MARPIEFDRDHVLQKALGVFWDKGYGATSMTDLVSAMDMRPGSIYRAFGNKQQLFLEVLDFYAADVGRRMLRLIAQEKAVKEGLQAIYVMMIEEMEADPLPKGCFVINTLLELSTLDDEAGARARKHLNQTREFIEAQIRRGQAIGEIAPDRSVRDTATFLQGTIYSLRVMGKARTPRKDLDAMIEQSLAAVFG